MSTAGLAVLSIGHFTRYCASAAGTIGLLGIPALVCTCALDHSTPATQFHYRSDDAVLTMGHVEQRDGRWGIVDTHDVAHCGNTSAKHGGIFLWLAQAAPESRTIAVRGWWRGGGRGSRVHGACPGAVAKHRGAATHRSRGGRGGPAHGAGGSARMMHLPASVRVYLCLTP